MRSVGPDDVIEVVPGELLIVTVSFGEVVETWCYLELLGVKAVKHLLHSAHSAARFRCLGVYVLTCAVKTALLLL